MKGSMISQPTMPPPMPEICCAWALSSGPEPKTHLFRFFLHELLPLSSGRQVCTDGRQLPIELGASLAKDLRLALLVRGMLAVATCRDSLLRFMGATCSCSLRSTSAPSSTTQAKWTVWSNPMNAGGDPRGNKIGLVLNTSESKCYFPRVYGDTTPPLAHKLVLTVSPLVVLVALPITTDSTCGLCQILGLGVQAGIPKQTWTSFPTSSMVAIDAQPPC